MNWQQAIRDKAQGTTDAAFWNAVADELTTANERIKELNQTLSKESAKTDRLTNLNAELSTAWHKENDEVCRLEVALTAERAISDKLEKALRASVDVMQECWYEDKAELDNAIVALAEVEAVRKASGLNE